jgi:beta-glucosidase
MKKSSTAKPPIYKNSALPVARRVKDLISRMTFQEEARKLVDADGNFDFQKAKAAFKRGRAIGQAGRPSDADWQTVILTVTQPAA